MNKSKNILVVASHPDDEVLGCGGTIYNLKKKGAKISVLFLSDGESSRKHPKISKLILDTFVWQYSCTLSLCIIQHSYIKKLVLRNLFVVNVRL